MIVFISGDKSRKVVELTGFKSFYIAEPTVITIKYFDGSETRIHYDSIADCEVAYNRLVGMVLKCELSS